MELTSLVLLLIAACSFVSEYIDSALGMGYGTTLTPVLLLLGLDPLQVVPAVLASEFITGLAAARLHHRLGNVTFGHKTRASKTTWLLVGCGVLGTFIAVQLALKIPRTFIGVYIGAMVTVTGALILITRRRSIPFSWPKLGFLGVLAAFNKGIGGGGYGTLITGGQMLSGLDAKQAIGIASLAESFVAFLGVVLYLVLTGPIDWSLSLALLSGALVSTPLAAFTVRRLHFRHLRTVVGIAASGLGVVTLTQFIVRLAR
jgi:uncharacterized protein